MAGIGLITKLGAKIFGKGAAEATEQVAKKGILGTLGHVAAKAVVPSLFVGGIGGWWLWDHHSKSFQLKGAMPGVTENTVEELAKLTGAPKDQIRAALQAGVLPEMIALDAEPLTADLIAQISRASGMPPEAVLQQIQSGVRPSQLVPDPRIDQARQMLGTTATPGSLSPDEMAMIIALTGMTEAQVLAAMSTGMSKEMLIQQAPYIRMSLQAQQGGGVPGSVPIDPTNGGVPSNLAPNDPSLIDPNTVVDPGSYDPSLAADPNLPATMTDLGGNISAPNQGQQPMSAEELKRQYGQNIVG
jgi:hypothetical protein